MLAAMCKCKLHLLWLRRRDSFAAALHFACEYPLGILARTQTRKRTTAGHHLLSGAFVCAGTHPPVTFAWGRCFYTDR